MTSKRAAVIVGGSWGTALATVLAENGYEVTVWTRNAQQALDMNVNHRNLRVSSIQDVVLPLTIRATTSIEEAVAGSGMVLFAATSASMREVAAMSQPFIRPDQLIVHATKGLEAESLKRMTIVLGEELPQVDPDRIVVLSGPSHAEEVIRRCPTTVVVAAVCQEAAERAQDTFINHYFRVYTNPDVTGVEVGGALKNIIALGAGMSDGLGFGDNAKAALMTRGLAEIARLGAKMDANPLTFAGLAGIGDLVVTCTSRHSRNWRAGYLLGQGGKLDDVLTSMGMVVEGVRTTKAASLLADRLQVSMPITRALHAVLFDGKTPKAAVEELMGRVRTHEIEEVAQSNWLL